MALDRPARTEIPEHLLPLLRAQGLAPRKALGQHFLTDRGILDAIVGAASLPPGAVVIEVGPGPGTLTAALLPHVERLVAIELDDTLAPLLASHFASWPGFHLVHGDALALDPAETLAATGGVAPYHLVGNLPYYITSALLRHYLEADLPPLRSVVTVQLDVAQRIVARPPQMSLLSVSVQVYAQLQIVRKLPPGAFTPPPKVHSAVLRLEPLEQPWIGREERETFFRVVRAGFGQKRKTLRNSLSSGLGLPHGAVEAALSEAGLAAQARAQELDLADWRRLAGQPDLAKSP